MDKRRNSTSTSGSPNPIETYLKRLAESEGMLGARTAERRERILRMQWRIDREIENKDPLEATLIIMRMLQDRLQRLQELLDILHRLVEDGEPAEMNTCKIIPFPQRAKHG